MGSGPYRLVTYRPGESVDLVAEIASTEGIDCDFHRSGHVVLASAPSHASGFEDGARALAAVDVLAGLAETAVLRNYTKPHVHDGDEMVVQDGRHPVVEAALVRQGGAGFVPKVFDRTVVDEPSECAGTNGSRLGEPHAPLCLLVRDTDHAVVVAHSHLLKIATV